MSKNKGCLLFLRWFFVLSFAIVAFDALKRLCVISAILYLAAAVLLAPIEPVYQLREKLKLSNSVLCGVAIFLILMVGVSFDPTAGQSKTAAATGAESAAAGSTSAMSSKYDNGRVDTVPIVNKSTPAPSAEPSPEPAVEATATPTPEPTAEAAAAPTPEPTAEVAAAPTPESAAVEQSERRVWITDNGQRYHSRPNCSNMKNPREVTISEATSLGKTPCSKC